MGSRFEPLFSSSQVTALGTVCLLVAGSVLAPARRSSAAAPHLLRVFVRPLYRAAHVERQRADSSSCCHLCSREQFWELMAANPANKVDTARC